MLKTCICFLGKAVYFKIHGPYSFSFIWTASFSAANSVSAHACLPVSVCRSHLPFPASSRVSFIPFRPALSMD